MKSDDVDFNEAWNFVARYIFCNERNEEVIYVIAAIFEIAEHGHTARNITSILECIKNDN